MLNSRRQDRHQALRELLLRDPLLTDEDLARQLAVSVPTIRLDRLSLGIPEVRQRAVGLARRAVSQVKSLEDQEVVGDLVDLELNVRASSVLETHAGMTFNRTGIVRSHHIFAQADSLALAVIDGEVVLTGLASSKFRRPVYAGERLVAEARVVRHRQTRFVVEVHTRSRSDLVFRGKFLVAAVSGEAVTHAHRA
jgi:acyl-coenzyme A thioesterase PaaI-like protein